MKKRREKERRAEGGKSGKRSEIKRRVDKGRQKDGKSKGVRTGG